VTRLIALTSPAMGSGKSTVADYLVARHNFRHVAFATPLKRMATAMIEAAGRSSHDAYARVYGRRKEEIVPVIGVSARRLMQLLGDEFGRQLIKPSIWIDITMNTVRTYMEAGYSCVIDDMRYPNEYDAVMHAGGDPLRIVRPDAVVTSAHASEGQLDGIHMRELFNGGTIKELHEATDRLLLR